VERILATPESGMTHRVGVVSDPTVGLGFRLAGLQPRVAESESEAVSVLEEMIEQQDLGVILVQEDLVPAPALGSWQRAGSGLPLVIPFPGPSQERPPGEAEAYVTELLRRAVGYRVRLR
jgi:vacuolar-type H+-ATPase subunit F/Vma7